MPSRPVSLFCLAASADADLLAEWEKHLLPLQQKQLLTCWSERHLRPGEDRAKQRATHLAQADYLVCCLSIDFVADDLCTTLMREAFQNQREKPPRIILLLVRPVTYPLDNLHCLPSNGKAITTWATRDEGWLQSVQELQSLLGLATRPNKQASTDRELIVLRLRSRYKEKLNGSLPGIDRIRLGIAEHPSAVRDTIQLPPYHLDQSESTLPADKTILSAYERATASLLILGDPGSGKSTLLLDLAYQLLEGTESNKDDPLPVILPLSSWAASKLTLSRWIVEQLWSVYQIPLNLGQQWVDQNKILPLLDGLDEMKREAQPLCIAAINHYQKDRQQHLPRLVVCSRRTEYEAVSSRERLKLQNAVVVQPLTPEQFERALQQKGEPGASLSKALQGNQELRQLATIPLMLSILFLAYSGTLPVDLPQHREDLEQRIWMDYVKRMVSEKGEERQKKGKKAPVKRYSLEQTQSYLGWLAQQMQTHDQTLFFGEMLLEGWLPETQRQTAWRLGNLLPVIILGAATSMVFALLPIVATNAPAPLLQTGLLGGFIGWCLCLEPQASGVDLLGEQQAPRIQNHRFPGVLLRAVLFTCGFLLFPHGSFWLPKEIFSAILMLVSSCLLQIVLSQRISDRGVSEMHAASRWSTFSRWWQQHLSIRQSFWTTTILSLYYGLSEGLSAGLSFGLSFGMICLFLSTILKGNNQTINLAEGNNQTVNLAERVSWNWDHLRDWHHIGRSFVVLISLIYFFGLSFGLNFGPHIGASFGLSFGVPFGLCYWLLLGLYRGLRQDHLEEEDRSYFNQGIHRSFWNGLICSLLGGGMLTGILALSIGVSNGLVGLLNDVWSFGPGLGVSSFLLLFFCSWVVLWALIGGLAIWRHYILRVLLSLSHTFPLQMQPFLNDAVSRALLNRQGGSYDFRHRQLLNYLAKTKNQAPQGT